MLNGPSLARLGRLYGSQEDVPLYPGPERPRVRPGSCLALSRLTPSSIAAGGRAEPLERMRIDRAAARLALLLFREDGDRSKEALRIWRIGEAVLLSRASRADHRAASPRPGAAGAPDAAGRPVDDRPRRTDCGDPGEPA